VERLFDPDLLGDGGVGRAGVARLAPGHLGLQARDLDDQGVIGCLAAAELGTGLGRVQPDQRRARRHHVAGTHQYLLDHAAFVVRHDLQLRTGNDTPVPRTVRSISAK
jgi:hypothetical protein